MATVNQLSTDTANAGDGVMGFIRANAHAFARTSDFAEFFKALGSTEFDRLQSLWVAVMQIQSGQEERGAHAVEALLRTLPDQEDGAGSVAMRSFAEALLGRLRRIDGSGGNLYLGGRPPGAQLRAFELLRLRTPLIPFAYAAGNRALLSLLSEPTDVTIMDVGIGRGGQIIALLRNPAAARLFKSLHVIGIEPDSSSATGAGALETAEHNVLAAARDAGISVSFAGIAKRAEELTGADLAAAKPRGFTVANGAFALHHVPPSADEPSGRDRVLRVLRESGAQAIILVEPDSDHYCDDLPARLLHSYRHYRSLAHSLHSMLTTADAELVWQEFFGPEVRNVITHDGPGRTERHEETGRWLERLTAAGWKPDRLLDLVPQSAAPQGFTLKSAGGAFCLAYRGVSAIGVLRARC